LPTSENAQKNAKFVLQTNTKMTKRQNISSGTSFEAMVGYSRAVRIGNLVEVAGTVANENGQIVGIGDVYVQTQCILAKIGRALEEAGVSMKDVIRTRIFVTNIADFEKVGKAHLEVFENIRPASSMIEVKGFVSKDYLVEIEVTAFLTE
jgi:enamine deaminase RidA (YjgF/YER057c/UK114 family)